MIDQGIVSILLGTYNGEKYIRQQLESIRSQTYPHWVLYISDDGSSDNTLKIIKEFSKTIPAEKLVLMKGPGRGFAENFLFMLKNKDINSKYYAFSDQDDVWLNDKIEKSLRQILQFENVKDEAVLYGGRTILTNNNLKRIGLSPLFKRKHTFQNSLVQSYAGGNTMIFNNKLKSYIEKLSDKIAIVSHDWFLYIVCSGIGGKIIYDPEPLLLYRQHERNLVGSNNSLGSKLSRLKRLYNGEFKAWYKLNAEFIDFYKDDLTQENLISWQQFEHCGDKNMFVRVKSFLKASVYRQSKLETMIFMMMSMLNKLK